MIAPDFLCFIFTSLAAHRLRSALTALGICVGIAAVILLTSIGAGLQQFVTSEFTQFGTNFININPGRVTTPAWAAVAAVATAVITGIAFSIMPARRAAQLDPVLALSGR